MYWYKVRVRQGNSKDNSYVGSMEIPPDECVAKLSAGEWNRINNLLYWDGREVHDWENWDPSVDPSRKFNERCRNDADSKPI
ncbi:hypothetical protein SH501x_003115 [Pirellulaceae bacterium SH501]